ncbi:MAG: hypothetical protein Q9168_002204 [Polycauliona sp. 1 TL-2023]
MNIQWKLTGNKDRGLWVYGGVEVPTHIANRIPTIANLLGQANTYHDPPPPPTDWYATDTDFKDPSEPRVAPKIDTSSIKIRGAKKTKYLNVPSKSSDFVYETAYDPGQPPSSSPYTEASPYPILGELIDMIRQDDIARHTHASCNGAQASERPDENLFAASYCRVFEQVIRDEEKFIVFCQIPATMVLLWAVFKLLEINVATMTTS